MRLSALPLTASWLGSLIFVGITAHLSAQELPHFRFDGPGLRPSIVAPNPGPNPLVVPQAVTSTEPLLERRVRFHEQPVTLLRNPLREVTLATEREPDTLRSPDGSAIAVRLSLALLTELRTTDNVSNLPPERAMHETFLELTPIMRITLGDNPDNRTENWIESEYYLDALYAPTWHWLLDAQEVQFLHHLIARAGRVTPMLRAAVRVEYKDSLFASASEGSPEDTFTIFEVAPLLEYRPSQITKLRLTAQYRRIALEDPISNRTEYIADGGIDVAMSVKTTAGLGAQLGRIEFDQPVFGTQRYVQGYLAIMWQATQKVSFQTRVGAELREFELAIPKEDKVTPVATAELFWKPSERTRLAANFTLRNQPSVVQHGALFEEMRFAIEATQDLGSRFYGRLEAEWVNRDYDTGIQETEMMLRPALGYHLQSSALLDAAQLEVFYQFRSRWNTGGGEDFARNSGGIQLTVFF